MKKPSLRDMKKEATWHILAETTFALALEKGLDGFTIEDVAQRAGYSRRTFANHFSCKEEAVAMSVLALGGGRQEALREDLLREVESITDDSPVDALLRWLRMQFTAHLLRKLRDLVKLSKTYPTLEPYTLNVLHHLQEAAKQELDRVCGDEYPRGYTHILAGAVFGAVLSILEGEVDVAIPGDPSEDEEKAEAFEQFVQMTFGYLKNGF
ncbi:hypothetical protein B9G55_12645 [Saccharibacillus sp. O16]|nr:hypothetical protein B9G55_12645 [Saccharibacillus sp. O16]